MWIVPGWYSERWWESIGDTSCTKDQVKKAAGNYLATRPLPLGGSRTFTVAGKVTNSIALRYEVIYVCSATSTIILRLFSFA